MAFFLLLGVAVSGVSAIDNGLGLKPPMGWRSWNLYGRNVNQKLIMSIMDGMVNRSRLVDGKPTSLCDLGYCDVGLDDMWQACGEYGKDHYTYHSESGIPKVDENLFPDFKKMTDYAHKLGLTAGWYLNNCICPDHCGDDSWTSESDPKCYKGDVEMLIKYGFDSVKLDGCGAQKDIQTWADIMNQTGKPIMIENCHWGNTVPTADWCPFNFYRTSGDVRASYGSVLDNLGTVTKFAEQNLSRPGCWAYPDMLEVGCQHGPGGSGDPGLSPAETRTHFGSWSIVSSPLTLSHDLHNDTIVDQIWPIIANPEAIEVNQRWYGHSGSPFKNAAETIKLEKYQDEGSIIITLENSSEYEFPAWQYLYKPVSQNAVAVLLMNSRDQVANLELHFADIPGLSCKTCFVRDIWKRQDVGKFKNGFIAQNVSSHDAAFLLVSESKRIDGWPVPSEA